MYSGHQLLGATSGGMNTARWSFTSATPEVSLSRSRHKSNLCDTWRTMGIASCECGLVFIYGSSFGFQTTHALCTHRITINRTSMRNQFPHRQQRVSMNHIRSNQVHTDIVGLLRIFHRYKLAHICYKTMLPRVHAMENENFLVQRGNISCRLLWCIHCSSKLGMLQQMSKQTQEVLTFGAPTTAIRGTHVSLSDVSIWQHFCNHLRYGAGNVPQLPRN
jgi:hypothetical protein